MEEEVVGRSSSHPLVAGDGQGIHGSLETLNSKLNVNLNIIYIKKPTVSRPPRVPRRITVKTATTRLHVSMQVIQTIIIIKIIITITIMFLNSRFPIYNNNNNNNNINMFLSHSSQVIKI